MVLIEAVRRAGPHQILCGLVRSHGPFCWGTSPMRRWRMRSASRTSR